MVFSFEKMKFSAKSIYYQNSQFKTEVTQRTVKGRGNHQKPEEIEHKKFLLYISNCIMNRLELSFSIALLARAT
jgi:hypothetical protein